MGGIAKVQLEGGGVKPSYTASREPRQGFTHAYEGGRPRLRHLTPVRFDPLLEKQYVRMIRQFSVYEIGARSKQDALAKFMYARKQYGYWWAVSGA
jgi:hypothetical protein